MRRASSRFSADDHARIAAAVHEAETQTAAEIVPVVATASGRYDRAEDLFGLGTAIVAFIAVWMLFQREDPAAGGWDGLPLTVQLPVLVAVLVVGFLVGAVVAARFGPLRRRLVSNRTMADEVDATAGRLFFDRRIHHTAADTGILVYVSLFERRAVILADGAAYEALGSETIAALCAELTTRLRTDGPAAALEHVIRLAGAKLAEVLPRGEGDLDEIADALVVLD